MAYRNDPDVYGRFTDFSRDIPEIMERAMTEAAERIRNSPSVVDDFMREVHAQVLEMSRRLFAQWLDSPYPGDGRTPREMIAAGDIDRIRMPSTRQKFETDNGRQSVRVILEYQPA